MSSHSQYAGRLLASYRANRGAIEKGVGKAKTVGEVALGSYAGARLSAHFGGTEGKKFLGMPLEVAIGLGCAAVAMGGFAGRYGEDVLALGLGSVSGYTARLGFTAGLKTTKAPAPPPPQVAGYVGYHPHGYVGAGFAGYVGAPNATDMAEAEAVLDALAA